MPAILSKIRKQHVMALASSSVALVSYISYIRMLRRDQRREDRAVAASGTDQSANGRRAAAAKKDKVQVDARFFAQMWRILKVLVPGFICPESGYLLLVAASLMCRTYADVWMIQNGTAIESAIISRSTNAFLIPFFKYVFAMPTISVINNILKYGLNELRLRFRSRLVNHLYKEYMRGFTFYKMTNLDSRIANPDQILTQDVEKFCDSIVELYSNISKPILDMFLYVHRLTSTIGFQGPASLLVYLFISGVFLTRLRRPLGKMTVIEQQHEGEFRHINSRVITNSEEIAFYQGEEWERGVLMATFDKLMAHLRKLVVFRFSMGFIDNIIAKYMATVVGYLVVSRAFLRTDNARLDQLGNSGLIEEYYKNGRMLVRLAEAVGRLALAGRELTRLAGFTARVTELMAVLKDLNKGQYVRTMVSDSGSRRGGSSSVTPSPSVGKDLAAQTGTSVGGDSLLMAQPARVLIPGSGEIVVQDRVIRFEDVPLVTPNGDMLIESLTFEVKSGTNVLVCGPNGCGKSSLFRILGELWPLFGGRMTKPAKGKLFYIPQRPYMATGSLRDQIIYPDSLSDMRQKGIKDADLERLLCLIQLSYILDREGGWESVQDWMDVLSGGEKQRVAMARLFYHAPQFAILDECTSAVSVDVEHALYSYCREVGITLFTVSHRKSLWKHHNYYLHMDGRGAFEFKPIDESTLEFGS